MTFLTVDRADGDSTLETNSMSEALQQTFTAALLLTGNSERAERSVLEAIRTRGQDQLSAHGVFEAAIRIAVSPELRAEPERSGEQEPPIPWLPVELQHVLVLPKDFRHAFVLRLLLGLHRSQCSRLLHLEGGELDKHVVSAVLALASIKAQQNGDDEKLGAVA